MPAGQRTLQFRRETLLDFNDESAPGADEMVVMAVVPIGNQFKSCGSISKIEPADESHLLQRVKVPVNGCQVATFSSQRLVNLAVGQRMLMPPEDIQDGLPRQGDLARMLPQLLRQFLERLLNQSMQVRM